MEYIILSLLQQKYSVAEVLKQTDTKELAEGALVQKGAGTSTRLNQVTMKPFREGKKGRWNDISRRIFFETSGRYYKTSKQCR